MYFYRENTVVYGFNNELGRYFKMDNIIAAILDIETNARNKISAAEVEKNSIIADAKAEEERILNESIMEADEKLKKQAEKEKTEAEKKLSEIDASKRCEIDRLNRVYDERHTEWENKIYSAIIDS